MTGPEATIRELFGKVGITPDGDQPHDPKIHDPRFYRRLLQSGSLGLGESYVEGWWDARSVDSFICRLLEGRLQERVATNPRALAQVIWARLNNLQGRRQAARDIRSHYEIGPELFRAMLDRRMAYSCAYWKNAETLDDAQEAKLELICRKLGLREGESLLDIGCGWGSLVRYAAERHGVHATGITISNEQAAVAREECRGLPVEIRVEDYRELTGKFDVVASVGMFEHVGPRNYQSYMAAVDRCLAPRGRSLLHTIAGNEKTAHTDAWIHRYIFPGSNLPTLSQIAHAAEGRFLIEDAHNFGPDYDRTLMAWLARFDAAWPELESEYDETFQRMWRYYLMTCAGSFRARFTQLFQVMLIRPGEGSPPVEPRAT